VLPTHEGLQAEDPSGTQVNHGLIIDAKLAGGHSPGQIGLEGRTGQHAVMHWSVEDLVACLAFALCHVHGEVGLPHQFSGIRFSAMSAEC
jgi:hypothetical protein